MKDKKNVLFKILVILGFFCLGMSILSIFVKKPKIEANKPREAMKMLSYDYKGYVSSDNILPSNYKELYEWTYTRQTDSRYYVRNQNPIILPAGLYVYDMGVSSLDILNFNGGHGAVWKVIIYDMNDVLVTEYNVQYYLDSNTSAWYYNNIEFQTLTDNYQEYINLNSTRTSGLGFYKKTNTPIDSNYNAYEPTSNFRDFYKVYFELGSGDLANVSKRPVNQNDFDLTIFKVADISDMVYTEGEYRLDKTMFNFRATKQASAKGRAQLMQFHNDYYQGTKYAASGSINEYENGYNAAISTLQAQLESYYERGYEKGRQDGSTDILNDSYETGYQNGYTVGKRDGYQQGVGVGETGNVKDLIESVVDTPFNIIYNLLNFEILGVNIWGFITSLLSILILIFVIKKLKH